MDPNSRGFRRSEKNKIGDVEEVLSSFHKPKLEGQRSLLDSWLVKRGDDEID